VTVLGPGLPDEAVIRGYPGGLVAVADSAGAELGPLTHFVRHSPTGFGWGYGGSGPAELARCILLAVLGADGRCGECDGHGRVVPTDDWAGERPYRPETDDEDLIMQCLACDAGSTVTRSLYQRFKRDHVARWRGDAGWAVRVGDVRAWDLMVEQVGAALVSLPLVVDRRPRVVVERSRTGSRLASTRVVCQRFLLASHRADREEGARDGSPLGCREQGSVAGLPGGCACSRPPGVLRSGGGGGRVVMEEEPGHFGGGVRGCPADMTFVIGDGVWFSPEPVTGSPAHAPHRSDADCHGNHRGD
jgi:hypothetical protein